MDININPPVLLSDSEDGENEFYFESDHLALRGNSDYGAILRTIAILQAQRIQATKDIDRIAEAEREALLDPEIFILKLQKGEQINLPGPINVIELPKINFEKYCVSVPELPKDSVVISEKVKDITVRGRIFDQSKPETFNQLWTSEEQRRLEELLIEYPPEPIEMRRFAKIAHALGNRTTKQVASRVQKFFKKLHSAGMPIPGRLPKSGRYDTYLRSYRMFRNQIRNSTFFPAQDVPVIMTEDDDSGVSHAIHMDVNFQLKGTSTSCVTVDQESDDETNTAATDDYLMLKLLQRIKNDKERFKLLNRLFSEHYGYKCDVCAEEPLLGTRWHCVTCNQSSVDFCSDCMVTQILNERKRHPISHRFIGIRVVNQTEHTIKQLSDNETDTDEDLEGSDVQKRDGITNGYDKDYLLQKFNQNENYNYMDPNFLL